MTSTMLVENATLADTPCRIAARAPMTNPPTGKKGSSSDPASRSIRAQMKTPSLRGSAISSSRNQAAPNSVIGVAE